MHSSAQRLARLLACATVPVALLTACSSGSGSAHDASKGASGAPSAPSSSPTASLPADKYAALPDACKAISQDTVKQMVPSAKDASGKAVTSSDPKTRGGCSWTGLDGYQFRFLDDSLQRFDSIPGAASGEDQAKNAYRLAVQNVDKPSGAKTGQVSGLGDEATLLTWDATKDDTDYHYATVVVRSANAVVTVDFSGAGLEGDDKPKADEMNQDAQDAAKQAVASLAAAKATPSASASAPAKSKPSASASSH
ncbi:MULTISPECIES: hypothetical protein [Streptomycetaceae]|uniref:DUF3558 domain-containing protein n=1 Tax=Streptantibioticus cattleyicolor (strain ATCC 35852 / DSM 46488 / JCM 4925 / NBRC 14057 / NRRL 8057) TaxID=1003195 RepID=F8JWK7_STREN|nr:MULTISPECIES: hypothetical protein [Streptomycetaceae]AEW95792.1 hypothetical protein SCATT_34210 [Streptantibioticus cattleyicolor NRRL 8057 = DSM 46488]MYS60335.1 DUF3558 domain-containing protein [Streptomyces sp. SID5468]CCB76131.1 Secreted protein [Streptantibioticus cattleyicolor NRRL 8057 = DSM 46488]